MKRLSYNMAAFLLAAAMLTAGCNNRGNETDAGGNMNDTNRLDSRRNTTDTTNYLTKDSGNQSQDVIDPEPPTQ